MKKINIIIAIVIGMITIQSYGQTDTSEIKKLQNEIIAYRKAFKDSIDKINLSLVEPYQKAYYDSIDRVNCMKFERVVDEFDKSVTITYDVNSDVSFIKIIEKASTHYYLSIYIKESSIYTGKGATIILSDKYKIFKPNERIDYTLINNQFYTTGFITLTVADLELFKKGEYMKYKLYISTGEYSYDPERIKCLMKSK